MSLTSPYTHSSTPESVTTNSYIYKDVTPLAHRFTPLLSRLVSSVQQDDLNLGSGDLCRIGTVESRSGGSGPGHKSFLSTRTKHQTRVTGMAPSRSLVGLLCLTVSLTVAHQVTACIFAEKLDPQQMAGMQRFCFPLVRSLLPRHSQGVTAFTGLLDRMHSAFRNPAI